MVLAALTEEPFEPLHHATAKDLMVKALFLLAAASAHIRSLRSMHFALIPLFLFRTMVLSNPAFLPKTSTEVDLELTAFYPEPTSPLEQGLHLMVPVRALSIYLQGT